MESTSSMPSIGKKLWHIVRVVYYMLRKSISKQKLSMDLHLLLKRGKIAGKTFGNLMTFNHRNRATTDTAAYYSTFSFLHTATKRKNRHHHNEAAVAKALEIFNSDNFSGAESSAVSPSITEEQGEGGNRIDMQAEEFIRWFHEQLRLQQLAVMDTPDISYRSGPLVGRA